MDILWTKPLSSGSVWLIPQSHIAELCDRTQTDNQFGMFGPPFGVFCHRFCLGSVSSVKSATWLELDQMFWTCSKLLVCSVTFYDFEGYLVNSVQLLSGFGQFCPASVRVQFTMLDRTQTETRQNSPNPHGHWTETTPTPDRNCTELTETRQKLDRTDGIQTEKCWYIRTPEVGRVSVNSVQYLSGFCLVSVC